jgi:DNA-binding response OmpR family regulator
MDPEKQQAGQSDMGMPLNENLSVLRFLVVDDDIEFNDTVAELVIRLGHKVAGRAFDGESALRIFAGDPGSVDVVVMDVVMPLKNGILAAEKMLRIKPGARILLMSGDWTNKSLVPDIGNIKFLHKPFGIEEMKMELESAAVAAE